MRAIIAVACFVLLFAPGLASAEFTVPNGTDEIRKGTSGFKDKVAEDRRRAEEAAKAEAAKWQAEHDDVDLAMATVEAAGIPLHELIAQDWGPDDLLDLAAAIRLASDAVAKLHAAFPSAVGDAYGLGAMTNIEDTFKLFGGGNLDRGCISHQSRTIAALDPNRLPNIAIKKIMVGKVMEHHAVIVFPKGRDWKACGVVLDGWPYQSSVPRKMVFKYKDWKGKFFALRFLMLNPIIFNTEPRLED